jgi:hypothetical protein
MNIAGNSLERGKRLPDGGNLQNNRHKKREPTLDSLHVDSFAKNP